MNAAVIGGTALLAVASITICGVLLQLRHARRVANDDRAAADARAVADRDHDALQREADRKEDARQRQLDRRASAQERQADRVADRLQGLAAGRIDAASSLSSSMLEALRHVTSLVEGARPGKHGERDKAWFEWRERHGELRERAQDRYALVSLLFGGRSEPGVRGNVWLDKLDACWRPANELFIAFDAYDHAEDDRKPAQDGILKAQGEVRVQAQALEVAWQAFNEASRRLVETVDPLGPIH